MNERWFTDVTARAADWAGRPASFVLACALVLLWAATGPYFHYSDTWQLVINTSTTILTFLMVFLIQASQNRSEVAIQTKLDELLASDTQAHKNIIGIERLTLSELQGLHREIERAVKAAEECTNG